MASRAIYNFYTAKGLAEDGQADDLAELRARLAEPGAKVLLHLHGGLVPRQSGEDGATRLAGIGDTSFNLDAGWTQIYIIWQTGALEEIKRRWTELAKDDRLYQALVGKLLTFLSQRLSLPLAGGRSAADVAAVSEDEIFARLRGERDQHAPFGDLEAAVAASRSDGARATLSPTRSSSELLIEFNTILSNDRRFREALGALDAAVNREVAGRAAVTPASVIEGQAILERLGDDVRQEFEPVTVVDPSLPPRDAVGRGFVSVGTFVLGRAMKAALRCIKRFRAGRDHGLQATIVEEICREFYGDKIGATIWGWMVDDARRHFSEDGFGRALIETFAESSPSRLVVTAHSAGSIWASHMLLAMKAVGAKTPVDLCLLAPAVRESLFAATLADAAPLIRRCHMFTMDDGLESADAVLGPDMGYIYPSSLLYLVSGLFETQTSDDYVDAPILGMQRFKGAAWLSPDEARDGAAIGAFFSGSDKAIHYSKGSGLTDADAHGAFDDNPLTLASLHARFFD